MRFVAEWKTRGKDYLVLSAHSDGSYSYHGRGCGGVLGTFRTDREAIDAVEAPWPQAGPATVLKTDRPSLRRTE